MKLAFGRYQGREIAEVPSEYLEWLLTCVTISPGEFKQALNAEMDRRGIGWDKNPRLNTNICARD